MRIEVLYVPGCPNHQPTVERIESVLISESLSEHVHNVPVRRKAKAMLLRFPGSPTVRVNGRDIERISTVVPALACRLYANGTGVPSEQMVRAAISEAKAKEWDVRAVERATPVAAVIAAFSSLACCLPFAFVGAAGFLGASARLQAMRPWLLAASGVLLVIGFMQLYFRKQCRRRSHLSVVIFWIATAIVMLLILFPQIAASILAG